MISKVLAIKSGVEGQLVVFAKEVVITEHVSGDSAPRRVEIQQTTAVELANLLVHVHLQIGEIVQHTVHVIGVGFFVEPLTGVLELPHDICVAAVFDGGVQQTVVNHVEFFADGLTAFHVFRSFGDDVVVVVESIIHELSSIGRYPDLALEIIDTPFVPVILTDAVLGAGIITIHRVFFLLLPFVHRILATLATQLRGIHLVSHN